MPNQKISELTTATNPSVNDVLPIVNEGSTKKITAASLLTNTLSASIVSLSGMRTRQIQITPDWLTFSSAQQSASLLSNVFLHPGGLDIAIGDFFTGQANRNTSRSQNTYNLLNSGNVFIGACAGRGCNKATYFGVPRYNIAIGSGAGANLGAADDSFCSGRTRANEHNVVIGLQAGFCLCSSVGYSPSKNTILGNRAGTFLKCYSSGNVFMGYGSARYLERGRHNVSIGYQAICDTGSGATRYIQKNVAIGYRAGRGLGCCSCHNVAIGSCATIGVPSNYAGVKTVEGSVSIGAYACTRYSGSIALGSNVRAYQCGDIVIGSNSRSTSSANNSIIIGRNNTLSTSMSGAIVLGSCNGSDIRHSFVLGSPVFPLSAMQDTTLTGQVSSLFVLINGQNRRIPILI
jgi:hypothetical protein